MTVDRQRITNYFKRQKRVTPFLCLLASVLLAAGVAAHLYATETARFIGKEVATNQKVQAADVRLGATILVVLTALYLFSAFWTTTVSRWRRGRHKYVDRCITDDRDESTKRALEFTGVHADEPLLVHGPSVSGALVRLGRDNVLRFSSSKVAVLLFAEAQLVVYQATIDHITGKYLNESHTEVFYAFVAGVAISDKSARVRLEGESEDIQINATRTFSLSLSGIEPVVITLGDERLAAELGGGRMPATDVEATINRARKQIRDRHPSVAGV